MLTLNRGERRAFIYLMMGFVLALGNIGAGGIIYKFTSFSGEFFIFVGLFSFIVAEAIAVWNLFHGLFLEK